jgi:hypothetical protein
MLRYRFVPTLTPFAPSTGIIACQAPPYQFERFSTISAIGATVPRCHWCPIVSGACKPAGLVAQQGVAVDSFCRHQGSNVRPNVSESESSLLTSVLRTSH